MAGSINLSLSQQFDRVTGDLLSGGLLYFFQAGTVAPQNAYKDSGLSITQPNPIQLASDGRIPQLYFADGFIHVRLTNSAGVVQFDEDNIMVVGPSSGGGGSGPAIDQTAIFRVGDIMWVPAIDQRTGWVKANGRTIGSSSSGATERANADCQTLFEYIWNVYGDTTSPVPGGRGASALEDWTANKQITLLDLREMFMVGASDMGNANRGGFAAVPVERYGPITVGGIIGEIQHTLVVDEMPNHDHSGRTEGETLSLSGNTSPASDGGVINLGANALTGIFAASVTARQFTPITLVDGAHSHVIEAEGADLPHDNTPRSMIGTYYVKL